MSRKTRAQGPQTNPQAPAEQPAGRDPRVIVTESEELERIIARQVQHALTSALPEAVRRATEKPYLTREEAAERLGCSERQVDGLRERGLLSYTKPGGRVLLRTSDVYELIEEGLVPARRRPASRGSKASS